MKVSEEIVVRIRCARSVAVLTGAGISAESDIPTFRGPKGIWREVDPEEVATPEAFRRDPVRVWRWHREMRRLVLRARPNPAHRALAELERACEEFTLITQNVDGLHWRAGSTRVVEVHGNILRDRCSRCGKVLEEPRFWELDAPPRCRCGGLFRPDVVWFGEPLPREAWEEAERAAEQCEAFLSVGTSASVYPAALLPRMAKEAGAYVVEVNLGPTDATGFVDRSLFGRAGEVMPALVEALLEGM
ncbi:MAG TPA: NAD-dependent deacylase [Candidatus Latescibacteria bacterium]|nr:NAD-dependent deacylase [Candidatus Latescibacterota bacterium]